jgi:hypothetical protein
MTILDSCLSPGRLSAKVTPNSANFLAAPRGTPELRRSTKARLLTDFPGAFESPGRIA